MPTTFALYQIFWLALTFLQIDTDNDFADLGRKLIGGFVAAVVFAIAFTLIRLRIQDKKPRPKFVSITQADDDSIPNDRTTNSSATV
jgi:hypothetical protein